MIRKLACVVLLVTIVLPVRAQQEAPHWFTGSQLTNGTWGEVEPQVVSGYTAGALDMLVMIGYLVPAPGAKADLAANAYLSRQAVCAESLMPKRLTDLEAYGRRILKSRDANAAWLLFVSACEAR